MPETTAPQRATAKHTAYIENRNEIIVDGISEVTSYDETTVVAVSEYGDVVVRGEGLRIKSFDRAAKKLSIEGNFSSLQYLDPPKKQEPFFKRLMK